MVKMMWVMALMMLSGLANAFDFGAGSIAIPEGFEGPVVKSPSEEFAATGFTKRHADSEKSTLLQITVFTPPNALPALDKEKQVSFSKQYLMQFLEGIKTRRENFKTSNIETFSLSGVPAVRIRWQGQAMNNHENLYGEMYCLIHKGNILSFHVQDFVDFDNANFNAARKAIVNMEMQ